MRSAFVNYSSPTVGFLRDLWSIVIESSSDRGSRSSVDDYAKERKSKESSGDLQVR